jgi:hypothetical protein
MTADASSVRSYARRIEHCWSRLLGRAVILSRRDWDRISAWHESGVPVELIQEAIDELAETPRRRAPRSLAYVAPAVDEAWQVVREGRTGAAVVVATGDTDPASVLREGLSRESEESRLAGLLGDLLRAYEAGATPAELDDRLDRELPGCAPPELLARVDAELRSELEPFAGRMSEKTFAATLRRARVLRLRAALELPRLVRDTG